MQVVTLQVGRSATASKTRNFFYTNTKKAPATDAATPKPVKTTLKHGLVLNLRNTGDGYVLVIWRSNQYPSFQEWNTILSCWPYKVGVINPHKGQHKSRWYLQACLPAHPKYTQVDAAAFLQEQQS